MTVPCPIQQPWLIFIAAFRHSLTANRYVNVLVGMAMILNQNGRFEHHVVANLYAVLGRQKTPGTDYGSVANRQNCTIVFFELRVRAKVRILIDKNGIAERDAVRMGSVQLAPKVNRYVGSHRCEWVCLTNPYAIQLDQKSTDQRQRGHNLGRDPSIEKSSRRGYFPRRQHLATGWRSTLHTETIGFHRTIHTLQ
jgi:hypothetical protein